jgi:hypothetical protein
VTGRPADGPRDAERTYVPVVPGAAGRALPRPGIQAQRREQVPARTARLRARVPAVNHDQPPSRLGRLVPQHLPEGAPAAVGDGLGQLPVADDVAHGQVFDRDHVMAADQGRGGAVQEVGAGRADFPVRAGDLGPGLDPVRGAFLAAGHPALIPGQGLCPAGQLPRVGDLVPAGTPGAGAGASAAGGTQDTSARNARSGSRFITVSAASDAA